MNRNKEFKDFFEGKLSRIEAEDFSAWLDSDEGKHFLESKIETDWNQENTGEYHEWDKDALLNKINKEKQLFGTRGEIPLGDRGLKVSGRKREIPSWFKVAAILIVILGSPLLYQKFNSTSPIEVENPVEIKKITRSNPAGVKSKFQLPDGSLVSLNSESTVNYSEDFAVNRSIELIGEAYFTVAKDSLHPFIVGSKGLKTEALGTVFNIKAYSDDSKVEILLVEGKVLVNSINSPKSVFLTPGEKVSLQDETSELVKSKGNIIRDTQWTVGVLEFKGLNFKEIFKQLERWYGVKIEVSGQMINAKGIGKFKEGETLENVLNVLSYSNDFNYKIDKDKVNVDFNK